MCIPTLEASYLLNVMTLSLGLKTNLNLHYSYSLASSLLLDIVPDVKRNGYLLMTAHSNLDCTPHHFLRQLSKSYPKG